MRALNLAFGLVTSATLGAAQAQFLVSELSFGHTGRINDRGEASVPGFSLVGTPSSPEILSNKIILTPPAPGNARGAAWGEQTNQYAQWVTDVDFRVNGDERGSGNLNIWLARNGNSDIGTDSIYTVGRFDGLALVIDQHGGRGGMVRGFLNDGTTDYKTHHSVDSLAFGHCAYSYRNLGRPSQIKLRQTAAGFKVEIDNRLCFESDQISIPPGYKFGLTAASADNPDSIEIFKMVVMTEDLNTKSNGIPPPSQQQQQQQQQGQDYGGGHMSFGRAGQNSGSSSGQGNYNADRSFDDNIPEENADMITSSKAQFADLHNRIQSINRHIGTIFREQANLISGGEKRHEEVSQLLDDVKQSMKKLDKVEKIDTMLAEITALRRDLQNTKSDLDKKIQTTEHSLKKYLGTNHGNLLEHVVTQTAPRHGKLIFIIIGSQIFLIVGYIWYERKKTSPKKYL